MNIFPVFSLQDMQNFFNKIEVVFLANADIFSETNLPDKFEIRKITNARASHLFFNTKKSIFAEEDLRRDLSMTMTFTLTTLMKTL